MIDRRDLAFARQQLVEVTTPPCWIFTVAISTDLGPIEDTFDPATYPRSGFCLRVPDRLQHLHYQVGAITIAADLIDRDIADYRVDIGCQRCRPLSRMLGIAPPRLVGFDILLGALLKG